MVHGLETLPAVHPTTSHAPLRWCRAQSLDEIEGWEAPWRRLDRLAGNPLSNFSWMRAFVRSFAADVDPFFVGAMRNHELVALAPLVRKRLHGIRRLCLAGTGELHEAVDLSFTDERALERLFAWLARRGSPLFLERITADSTALNKIKRAYRGRAIVLVRPQASYPYIALDESWLDPEMHLNAGRRSDLRRARRKAEQLGPVTTEIHTPDLSELSNLMDAAFDVEASSWKGEAHTALLHDAHRAAFYRQYAESACTEGVLRICFLRIGDRLAAVQLAIEQNNGFWLLKVGYDARFSQCSPGLLLMRDTIRYAAEAGLRTYEFLGRAEAWTKVWTATEHACVSVRVYPFGLRGMAALTADSLATVGKRWRKKDADG
jgi:CelD/BcsL family acetyltransferase involved in cellulose biosynthesis